MKSETLIKIERNKQKYFQSLTHKEIVSSPDLIVEESSFKKPAKPNPVKISLLRMGKNAKYKIVDPLSKQYLENHQKIAKAIQQKSGKTRDRVYSFLEVLFDA
jgi:hypothetical protein